MTEKKFSARSVACEVALVSRELASLDRAIEDSEAPLEQVVVDHFKALLGEHKQGIDNVILALSGLEDTIAGARARRNYWDQVKHRAEAALSAAKETIKAAIEDSPNLPFSGELGRLTVRTNGGKPALIMNPPFRTWSMTYSNIVDPLNAFEHDVPREYLKTQSLTTLDTEAIRGALESGREIPWARLERGTHLSWPRPRQ